jgi:hypothetical protein
MRTIQMEDKRWKMEDVGKETLVIAVTEAGDLKTLEARRGIRLEP